MTTAMNTANRIAMFIPSMGGGGAERVFANLSRGFVERGYPVDLLLVRRRGELLDELPPSVRVIELPSSRIITSCIPLKRYLEREEPAVLLSALDSANMVAIVARSLADVDTRLVVSVHNTLSLAASGAPSLRLRLLPFMAKYLYRRADAVVGVSRGVATDLVEKIGIRPDRVRVLYNPIVTEQMLSRQPEEFNESTRSYSDKPFILGIGRLTAQKNFSLLVRASADVLRREDMELVILGEGDRRQELEELITELNLERFVRLPGFVPEALSYLQRASLFVLSSDWEGLPTVLIEALSCGCPIVSTDCPSGPREILNDGEYGALVPPGDEPGLREAIRAALEREHDPARLRERARHFTVDRSVEAYLRVLLGDRDVEAAFTRGP